MASGRRARPPVRHGKRRGDGGAWRAVLATVAVIAASTASLGFYAGWTLTNAVSKHAVDIGGPVPTIGPIDGAFTVMIAGIDNAPGQTGFGESRQASMNDVDIVVHVAANHQSATVLSIPRDLTFDQPACTDPTTHEAVAEDPDDAINVDYSRGGLPCIVQAAEQLTGLQIPYAVQFSFESTVDMADAVGGVEVCSNAAINDPSSGLVLKKGVSVISGRTALAYLRDRHGVGDGSDLSRISSQESYMSSLMRKMVSSGTLGNPVKLYGLASVAAHELTFSTSLADPDTMVQMLLALRQMPLSAVTFVQFPNELDPENTNKVVPNTSLAATLMQRIESGQPVVLAKGSTGTGVSLAGTVASSEHSASSKAAGSSPSAASPSPTASATPIAGVMGQTAAQRTCSVAFSG